MIEAYKKFWKNYVNFEGKSSRSDYWYVVLMNALIMFACWVLLLVSGGLTALTAYTANYDGSSAATGGAVGFGILAMIIYFGMLAFGLAIFIPNLAITVRRLRDGGYPWGFIFFGLIPFVGGIVLLVFMCMPTKEDGNRKEIN